MREKHREAQRGTDSIVLFTTTLFVVVAFYSLFLFKKVGPLDFWWWFTAIVCIFCLGAGFYDRSFLPSLFYDITNKPGKKIFLGLTSAGILYALFSAGELAARIIFPFAEAKISEVYEIKAATSLWRVVPLLTFVIGPGEELLWRGFIQKQYSKRYNQTTGFIISVALYTLVHFGSRNFMLVLSALTAGLYWSGIYRWRNSLLMNIVSHIAWDLSVFIIFPF